mmetsp:Transcript_32466/g.62667  ORF Transcript_32466/g.62667 Transcript_32466/m.62667 type:complete len:186 (+) Transcript_32466:71-628(+)
MHALLCVRGVSAVTAPELISRIQGGIAGDEDTIIVDLSPRERWERYHVPGAQNVELFRLIKDWDFKSMLRRANFALFMDFQGTERNPEFLEDFKRRYPPPLTGKTILLIDDCEFGTLEGTKNFPDGRISRSLIAATELLSEGGYDCTVAFLKDSLVKFVEDGGTLLNGDGEPVDPNLFRLQDMMM